MAGTAAFRWQLLAFLLISLLHKSYSAPALLLGHDTNLDNQLPSGFAGENDLDVARENIEDGDLKESPAQNLPEEVDLTDMKDNLEDALNKHTPTSDLTVNDDFAVRNKLVGGDKIPVKVHALDLPEEAHFDILENELQNTDAEAEQSNDSSLSEETDLSALRDDNTASKDLDGLTKKERVLRDDARTASKNLDDLTHQDNPQEYEGYEDDNFEAENAFQAFSASKSSSSVSLLEQEDSKETFSRNSQVLENAPAVLDEVTDVAEDLVSWHTQTPPHADNAQEYSDLEKRASVEASERGQGPKVTYDLGRTNGIKDVQEVPGFPAIRVIQLNETLYLNHTDSQQPAFQPVALPESFDDYDVNGNGWISLAELLYVTGATEGATDAFNAADVDGDGRVDRDEFAVAQWGVGAGKQENASSPRSVILMPAEELKPSSNPRSAEDHKAP